MTSKGQKMKKNKDDHFYRSFLLLLMKRVLIYRRTDANAKSKHSKVNRSSYNTEKYPVFNILIIHTVVIYENFINHLLQE